MQEMTGGSVPIKVDVAKAGKAFEAPLNQPAMPISIIPADEIEFTAIRAQGAGGQNINKLSSVVHTVFIIGQVSGCVLPHSNPLVVGVF